MSTTNTVDISAVPRTYEYTDIGVVTNPMSRKFVYNYNGTDITVKAKGKVTKALPIAVLIAEHMAKMIVAEEHEDYLKETRASDKPAEIKEKIVIAGITNYDTKIKETVDKILTIENTD